MLLDAAEIFCGSPSAIPDRWAPLAPESIAFVCCPEPYRPCSKAERVPKCDDVVEPFLSVDPSSLSITEALGRLQQARGALARSDGSCASLGSEEPHAQCNTGDGAAFN